MAREIASNPKLLIAHQPTRGLDVGAIEFVHGQLLKERENDRGVLLVSLEFEEIRALADRILVIYEGKTVVEFPPDVSEEELGVAMTGGRGGAGPRRELLRRARRGSGDTSLAARRLLRGGGVIVPLLTTLLASGRAGS